MIWPSQLRGHTNRRVDTRAQIETMKDRGDLPNRQGERGRGREGGEREREKREREREKEGGRERERPAFPAAAERRVADSTRAARREHAVRLVVDEHVALLRVREDNRHVFALEKSGKAARVLGRSHATRFRLDGSGVRRCGAGVLWVAVRGCKRIFPERPPSVKRASWGGELGRNLDVGVQNGVGADGAIVDGGLRERRELDLDELVPGIDGSLGREVSLLHAHLK